MDQNIPAVFQTEELACRTNAALGGVDSDKNFQNENIIGNSRRNSMNRIDENREFDPFQVCLFYLIENCFKFEMD